ncbi:MAG: oligosaccharide repeat unit polymerase [Chitinophagaceae bacterium]|nr:oligosaccharide repeat unit polymerase [Chitinophagaceae bacterium]
MNLIILENILFGKSKNKPFFGIIAFICSIFLIPLQNFFSVGIILFLIITINLFLVISLISSKNGLIPCSRYLFLVAPGFLQLFVYAITSGSVTVAILANDFIDINLIKFVATISTIGAASANLGFCFKPFILTIQTNKFLYSNGVNNIILFLFIMFAIYYGYSLGDSLFETGQYATNTNSTKTVVGVVNVFYFYFLSLFILAKFWVKNNYRVLSYNIYLFIIILIIFYVAIKGVRQDSIGLLLAIFAILFAKKNVQNNNSPYFYVLLLFFISWIGSTITGGLRENFSSESLVSLSNSLPFFLISGGYVVFNMNTASMTIGTLNVIPYKIIEKGYLLGKTYLDWIPRTLPEFILKNRPEGPEFDMHYNGIWFGWGGIHEIAEAYWNFGYIGIVIIPFVISYFLNSFGKSFLRGNLLYATIPVVWLIMMPRWIWYQSFALYKSTITMLIIVFIFNTLLKKQTVNAK